MYTQVSKRKPNGELVGLEAKDQVTVRLLASTQDHQAIYVTGDGDELVIPISEFNALHREAFPSEIAAFEKAAKKPADKANA
jgi:hypothetical protein